MMTLSDQTTSIWEITPYACIYVSNVAHIKAITLNQRHHELYGSARAYGITQHTYVHVLGGYMDVLYFYEINETQTRPEVI